MLQADLPWDALPSLRVSGILDRLLVVSMENRKLEGFCKKIFSQGYPKQKTMRRYGPILRVHRLGTLALTGTDLRHFFTFFFSMDHRSPVEITFLTGSLLL